MNFAKIERKVIDWGTERDIYLKSGPLGQYTKLMEEANELLKGIYKYSPYDIKDSIGDMLVVLTGIAHMYDLDLTSCYLQACEEIKNRKGKVVDGIFVKEER